MRLHGEERRAEGSRVEEPNVASVRCGDDLSSTAQGCANKRVLFGFEEMMQTHNEGNSRVILRCVEACAKKLGFRN